MWHYHTHTLQGHLTNIKQSRVSSDAAQALASSPNDVLKSTVFSCYRKAASDCSSLTKDGREFQARAAAAGNARSPRVRRRVAGTISVDVAADRTAGDCRNCGWLSNARSRRGTEAQYHEGIGRSEQTAETLSSQKLSTNRVLVF